MGIRKPAREFALRRRPLTAALGVLTLLVAVVAIPSTALAAQSKAAKTSHAPYKVIIEADLSNDTGQADVGAELDATEAVFKTVNAQGGINGHPITWTTENEEGLPSPIGTALATENVAANPTAIVGADALTEDLPAYEHTKIPVFGLENQLFEPWLYGAVQTNGQDARVYIAMIEQALGVKTLKGVKVDMVTLNAPQSVAIGNSTISDIKKAGGTVPTNLETTFEAVSFASQAAQAISDGVKAVALDGAAPQMIIEAKALVAAGFTGVMAAPYDACDFLTMHTINSTHYYCDRSSPLAGKGTAMATALAKYKFPADPNDTSLGGDFAEADLLVKGLQKCAYPCGHQALINAVNSLGSYTAAYNSLTGPAHVSKTSHNILTNAEVLKWSGTQPKIIGTVSLGAPTY